MPSCLCFGQSADHTNACPRSIRNPGSNAHAGTYTGTNSNAGSTSNAYPNTKANRSANSSRNADTRNNSWRNSNLWSKVAGTYCCWNSCTLGSWFVLLS